MRIHVITAEEMTDRNGRFRTSGLSRDDFERGEMERTGQALFVWWPDRGDHGGFTWLCPGCARLHSGLLGATPVSGWDDPRWVNSGTEDAPTLTPSLGCGGWKHGTCPGGHYWLRDGVLEPA